MNHSSPWGTLSLDSKGRIVIAGWFDDPGIHRFLPDGTRDTNYAAKLGSLRWVRGATVLPDDSAVVARTVSSTNHLVKLDENGALNDSFKAPPSRNSGRLQLASDAQGRVYVAAARPLWDAADSYWPVFRVLPNGDLDPAFRPPPGNPTFTGMLLQADGKVLLSLQRPHCAPVSRGEVCGSLFRLNEDGSLDDAFRTDLHRAEWTHLLAIEPGGRILIGGPYELGPSLQRLFADGSRDPSLWTGTEHVGASAAIGLDDGSVLVSDYLWAYFDGEARYPLVRIHPAPVAIGDVRRLDGAIEIRALVTRDGEYALESSEDFATWARVAIKNANAGAFSFTTPSAGKASFFRVVAVSAR